MASSQPATSHPSPSVIWLSAQACSGCPVSLLNRMVMLNGKYYDADMLNALYTAGLPTPGTLTDVVDPTGSLELSVVNDAADLLIGDGVKTLVNLGTPNALTRSLVWADDLAGVMGAINLTGSLLDAYDGAFPTGYITLDWNATVMASAGDIAAGHLKDIREGGGILEVFVLVVDGSIPGDGHEEFCYVFDNDDGASGKVIRQTDTINSTAGTIDINYQDPVTANEALEWLAGAPGCIGVISQGTCSSYGGIPAGLGNRTGAGSVADFLASKGVGTPVINVPGCPPHPDWTVYPIAYILANSTPSNIVYPPMDRHGRPRAVFSGSKGDDTTPFCWDCANKDTQGQPEAAQTLGDAGCVGGLGCKGPYTVGDCPIRGKNTADDGTIMNWCVGAQGQNSASGVLNPGIGSARHPCQGCIMPDFPDFSGLTGTGERTTGRVKGFYNE
jgi:hydrogenase small subunit